MKRKDILKEIKRENATRRRVFPKWIQAQKIHRDIAEERLQRTQLIESILEVMTDQEFTQLVSRTEINSRHEQGSLF